MSNYLLKSVFLIAAVTSGSLAAFERQHEAHVHGEAELNLVLEGQKLSAELKSPLMNIVGFEHEATSAADKAAIAAADKALEDVYNRFKLPKKALCLVDTVEVHMASEHDEHDEHGHEEQHEQHTEHDHSKDHDQHEEHAHENEHHDHHKEHAHTKDHDEHNHEEAEHRDLHAHYEFKCVKPEALDQIELDFFTKFPGMEALHVNLLDDKGAQQVELTSENRVIKF